LNNTVADLLKNRKLWLNNKCKCISNVNSVRGNNSKTLYLNARSIVKFEQPLELDAYVKLNDYKMKNYKMKKVLGETQTLRAGRSTVEPNIFCPAADPLPGGAGRPKFNQLEMVTTFIYRPSLVKIDARNLELSC